MDHDHANAYTAWQQMGSPQTLTQSQVRALQHAAQLFPDTPAGPLAPVHGTLTLHESLPRQGVTLFHIELTKSLN